MLMYFRRAKAQSSLKGVGLAPSNDSRDFLRLNSAVLPPHPLRESGWRDDWDLGERIDGEKIAFAGDDQVRMTVNGQSARSRPHLAISPAGWALSADARWGWRRKRRPRFCCDLAAQGPDAFRPNLAAAWAMQANCLDSLDRSAEQPARRLKHLYPLPANGGREGEGL